MKSAISGSLSDVVSTTSTIQVHLSGNKDSDEFATEIANTKWRFYFNRCCQLFEFGEKFPFEHCMR
jgi:hypothetical protein